LVTNSFKRKTASWQAASRKVEGIEPRKHLKGKGDAVERAEAYIDCSVIGRLQAASPGSETVACLTLRLHGNLGDPVPAFLN